MSFENRNLERGPVLAFESQVSSRSFAVCLSILLSFVTNGRYNDSGTIVRRSLRSRIRNVCFFFPRIGRLSIIERRSISAAKLSAAKRVNAPIPEAGNGESKRLPLPNQASIMPVSYTRGQTAYGGFAIHHMYQHTLVFSRAIGSPVAAIRVLEERARSCCRIDHHLVARRFVRASERASERATERAAPIFC